MNVISLLAPYHQQDYDTFCGPATAQMILAPLRGGELENQAQLKVAMNGVIVRDRCKLATSPERLAGALNATLGVSSQHQFAAYYCPDAQHAANDILRQTLSRGTAAAGLIFAGRHWVAVTGFTTAPDAVYLNNPWPVVPEGCCLPTPPPPPPTTHTTSDGCGTGMSTAGERGNPEHVPLEVWNNDYLTAVTACRLPPQTYVVVGTASARTDVRARRPRGAGLSGDGGSEFDARDRKERRYMIEPSEAVTILRDGIEKYGVAEDAAHAHQSGQRPRLVQRLDREREFYHIVSLTWPDRSTLVGRVDAHRGVYLGAQLRPAGDYRLMEPEYVRALIEENGYFSESASARHEARFEVDETLVWRPCRESRSPYYPLSRVRLGGETVGYVDFFGLPHMALHDLTGG